MEETRLIVGLGNPGRQYADTRHNIGFMVVERFAAKKGLGWSLEKRFKARLAKYVGSKRSVWLVQPQTFMNLSGEAVRLVADYYRVGSESVLVVVDDADLAFGQIRMKKSGSAGGHHGLESVEQQLGTRDYPRQRLGIGRQNERRNIAGYVLEPFDAGQRPLLDAVLAKAEAQIGAWLEYGALKAMNEFNGSVTITGQT